MAGGHLLRHDLQSGHGVIHVEALAFAVAEHTILDRMAAAARVGELRRGRDLVELAEQEWPGTDCLGLVHHGHRSFAISEPSPQRAAGGSGHGASGRQCWRGCDKALAETINGLFKAEVLHRRGSWRSFEAVE